MRQGDERRASSSLVEGAILLIQAAVLGMAFISAWIGRRPERTTIAEEIRRRVPRLFRGAILLGIGTMLVFGVVVFGRYYDPQPPQQPIPFSHHLHVTTKKLNCFFCHQYAARANYAGMPPVRKCLLCHGVIATRFWAIQRIKLYDLKHQGIPWVRVYKLPQFVHFSHQIHISRGVDCSYCHGNVRSMDRIREVNRFDMNYCVTCHWRNNASSDCFTCHY